MTEYTLKDLLLKVENVNLFYGPRHILRDINMEVRNIERAGGVSQGQVVALIGRSGLGKTQLFRILSGLMPPTSGTVLIDVDQHPVHAGQVGIIPQEYILFNHHTVYQNLQLGAKHSPVKRTPKEAKEIIDQYVSDFELTEHIEKYPMQLSGGQRQRVSIIQQVLTDNKFILLDEPFSGLDRVMIRKVTDLLIKVSTLNEFNTLVIVSHDLESSMALADTVLILATETGKEGATFTHNYDLKEMGMAWEPHIRERPDFHKLLIEVEHIIGD